jgi:hypothetical protein
MLQCRHLQTTQPSLGRRTLQIIDCCARPRGHILNHDLAWAGRKLPITKLAEDAHPAAAGSAECTVLCAKVLTNSDASSGRIILPRIYVEANLSFVIGYRCLLKPLTASVWQGCEVRESIAGQVSRFHAFLAASDAEACARILLQSWLSSMRLLLAITGPTR